MHKWLTINQSFVFALISLTCLISMWNVQKNFDTKMRLPSLISIYIKKIIKLAFMHFVQSNPFSQIYHTLSQFFPYLEPWLWYHFILFLQMPTYWSQIIIIIISGFLFWLVFLSQASVYFVHSRGWHGDESICFPPMWRLFESELDRLHESSLLLVFSALQGFSPSTLVLTSH